MDSVRGVAYLRHHDEKDDVVEQAHTHYDQAASEGIAFGVIKRCQKNVAKADSPDQDGQPAERHMQVKEAGPQRRQRQTLPVEFFLVFPLQSSRVSKIGCWA